MKFYYELVDSLTEVERKELNAEISNVLMQNLNYWRTRCTDIDKFNFFEKFFLECEDINYDYRGIYELASKYRNYNLTGLRPYTNGNLVNMVNTLILNFTIHMRELSRSQIQKETELHQGTVYSYTVSGYGYMKRDTFDKISQAIKPIEIVHYEMKKKK